MDDVVRSLAELEESRAALASLVWSSGSIPMSDRAKMLIKENGQVLGTIGGGCLEAEIFSVARQVIETEKAHVTRYTMTEKQAGESGLNCGGSVRIFTEPMLNRAMSQPYVEIVGASTHRRVCVLATLLNTTSRSAVPGKMIIYEDGSCSGSLGSDSADLQVRAAADKVFGREGGRVVELELDLLQRHAVGMNWEGPVEVFLEPFAPPPVLYVFGGGHVGGEICKLAKSVGFRVVVVDDRPMFANQDRHPEADECLVDEMDAVFHRINLDEQSYIVAATRGHQHDELVIRQAIRTPARYIGMLGSERKKMLMWKRLEEQGGSRERLDQLYAPIGLNIGADTPEEIAVSVVGELIKARRGVSKVWKTKAV